MAPSGLNARQEALRVNFAPVVRDERVAARTGHDEQRLAQRPAGPVHDDAQIGGRITRGLARPQRFPQDVPGDELSPARDEDAHEGTSEPTTERARGDLRSVAASGKAPEQLNVDHVTTLQNPDGWL